MKTLVIYATIEGQTGKIANFVKDEVRKMGHDVALVDANDPTEISFEGIDAVIMAAPVHERRHPQNFEALLTAHVGRLARLKTLLISVSLNAAFPEGIEEARSKVRGVLKKLRGEFDEVYLGGFSQGSMVSADIAFHNPELVDKLFLLSSTMVSEDIWKKACHSKLPFKIFQSHGVSDPVLPVVGARDLKSFLESSNNAPEYIEFQGAHEVPPIVVTQLDKFLRES